MSPLIVAGNQYVAWLGCVRKYWRLSQRLRQSRARQPGRWRTPHRHHLYGATRDGLVSNEESNQFVMNEVIDLFSLNDKNDIFFGVAHTILLRILVNHHSNSVSIQRTKVWIKAEKKHIAARCLAKRSRCRARYSREKEISESVGCEIFRPFPYFTQRNQTTHALGDALRRVFIAWKYANMNLGGKFK